MGARQSQNEGLKLEYIDWLRLPNPKERERLTGIRTRNDWAAKHHIDRTTLFRWESSTEFKKQMLKRNLDTFTTEQINGVLAKVAEQALEGKAAQQRMFLKMVGVENGLDETEEQPEEVVDFSGWSPDKIQEYLDSLDESDMDGD